MPSRKNFFKLIFLITLSTLFGMLLCEFALRVFIGVGILASDNSYVMFLKQQESTAVSNSVYRVSSDKVLGVELNPGTTSRDIRVNSSGFRGKEFNKQPAQGMERVVFLGDSETFGAFLKENENITGQLEIELNKRGGGERKFEVLNFGFPGYNTIQEARVLLTKAIDFNPSIVVLYYVLNDPILGSTTTLEKRTALNRSYFYNLVMFYQMMNEPSFHEYQHKTGNIVDFYKKIHDSKEFEITKKFIRNIGDYLEERNIEFYMLIAPEVIGFKDFTQYPYKEIHSKLLALTSNKIDVVDPLPKFVAENIDPLKYWVIPSDCHKNTLANGMLAGVLAERILKK